MIIARFQGSNCVIRELDKTFLPTVPKVSSTLRFLAPGRIKELKHADSYAICDAVGISINEIKVSYLFISVSGTAARRIYIIAVRD